MSSYNILSTLKLLLPKQGLNIKYVVLYILIIVGSIENHSRKAMSAKSIKSLPVSWRIRINRGASDYHKHLFSSNKSRNEINSNVKKVSFSEQNKLKEKLTKGPFYHTSRYNNTSLIGILAEGKKSDVNRKNKYFEYNNWNTFESKPKQKRSSLTILSEYDNNKQLDKTTVPKQSATTFNSSNSGILSKNQRPLVRVKRDSFTCEPSDELDDYVDGILRYANIDVTDGPLGAPLRMIQNPPNATIDLPDYNVQIFLYDGKAPGINKLIERVKETWSFCNNETSSVGLTLVLRKMILKYKYRVINGSGERLLFDGDLVARLSPRVQIQYSEKKMDEKNPDERVQRRIDRIKIFRLGTVDLIIRGLGNLTQSLTMLINSYLNDRQEELQPLFRMLERRSIDQINKSFANADDSNCKFVDFVGGKSCRLLNIEEN